MKYKHMVFDIDGTLIDTEYAVLHSLQETIKGLSGREIPCSELGFRLTVRSLYESKPDFSVPPGFCVMTIAPSSSCVFSAQNSLCSSPI